MSLRRYVAAIDRSSHCGLEVFSIIVTCIDSQNILTRYSDFFKHLRKLGSQKRTYIPKMLRVINQLIDENIIIGLRVFTRLDDTVETVHRRETVILTCIVDNNIYHYYTTNGVRISSYLKNIPLVLLESMLKKPSKELIEKTHRAGLTMVFLRTVMKISDNVANYTRSMFEKKLQEIPQVWRL